MLKACLNGARQPFEHPRLPVSPSALARDAVAVTAAGADMVHLHVKDRRGVDTLDGPTMESTLRTVRSAAPSVPVGVTTGAWAEPDVGTRMTTLRSWSALEVRPDFASVNWHEQGADEAADALLGIGVGVEAGLWHRDVTMTWLSSPHRDHCLRVLLELPDGLTDPQVEAESTQLMTMVRDAVELPIVLHGEGSSAWPALRLAGRLEVGARIGLEDVLVLPDGSPAPDNATLVRVAQQLLGQASSSAGPRFGRHE